MHLIVVVLLALVTEWEKVWSSPVPFRMVELTHIVDNSTIAFPPFHCFQSHHRFLNMLGVTVQEEVISTTTHVGTHIDAPCSVVRGRQKVTEIPLERLVAPAAVVDVCHKVAYNRDYELQIEDLLEWEHKTGILLNDVILLMRSGWSKYWGNSAAYLGNSGNGDFHFPGIAPSTGEWLVKNRNVYGVGIDTIALSSGQAPTALIHTILFNNNVYGLPNVGDMDELPLFGAMLHVMPMRIGGGACGAPVRMVAFIPDKGHRLREW